LVEAETRGLPPAAGKGQLESSKPLDAHELRNEMTTSKSAEKYAFLQRGKEYMDSSERRQI
jgi:hypothetical protein